MLTLDQLREKVRVARLSQGEYLVSVQFRGKVIKCVSYNSLAFDRLDDDSIGDRVVSCGYTNRGSYQAFYDECRRKNQM